MTEKNDLKALVRARMEKTGEKYATALRHVRGAKTDLSALPSPQRELVYVGDLFDYLLRKDHTVLVQKRIKEFGPYPTLRLVPDAELNDALATDDWRELTDDEVRGAEDAAFNSFEDYSAERDWDF